MTRKLAALACVLAACGGESGSTGGAVEVHFRLFQAGGNVPCSAVAAITAVEVDVLGADGISSLPGFPKPADCGAGVATLSLSPGSYTVIVSALGPIAQEPKGVLYRARSTLDVPQAAPLELSLEPQVAALSLSWSFEAAGNLVPCADEVDGVEVTVSAGTSGDSFSRRYACRDTPVALPVFFRPMSYVILVSASSAEGFPIYGIRETRVLERGANDYAAILDPAGGRLILQWRFQVPGMPAVPDCSDPQIGVSQVLTRVTTPLGDDPVIETAPCVQNGPYALRASRFTQGRPLSIEVLGEGVHRFRHFERRVMPATDLDLGVVTLFAVGSATVAWTLTSSSACAGRAGLEFDVEIEAMGAAEPVLAEMVPGTARALVVPDLPYGRYTASVFGRVGRDLICTASAARAITRRGDNAWEPLSL